jgi:voltage-gated potassium channel
MVVERLMIRRRKFTIPKEDHFGRKIGFALLFMLFLILFGMILLYGGSNSDNSGKLSVSQSFFRTISLIIGINLEELNNNYSLIIISILGSVTQFYIIYVILEFVLDGKLKNMFSEVKILNHIKSVKDHYIICGGGRVGTNVALELHKYKRNYVIIEADKEKIDRLKEIGIIAFTGDCLDENTLKKAGIQHAKYLIACMGDDGDNLLLILTAKELNPNLTIATRSNDEKISKKLRHAGAQYTIMPEVLGGMNLAHSVIRDEIAKSKAVKQ